MSISNYKMRNDLQAISPKKSHFKSGTILHGLMLMSLLIGSTMVPDEVSADRPLAGFDVLPDVCPLRIGYRAAKGRSVD